MYKFWYRMTNPGDFLTSCRDTFKKCVSGFAKDEVGALYPQSSELPPTYESATEKESTAPPFYPGYLRNRVENTTKGYLKELFRKISKPGKKSMGPKDIMAYVVIAAGVVCMAQLIVSSVKTICCLLFVTVTLSLLAGYNKSNTVIDEAYAQDINQQRLLG